MTLTLRYDRANRGRSDPAPTPHTADFPGPYVLVGHSLGGLIVGVFTAAHPHVVAGMVLVDPLHEDQFERATEVLPAAEADESPQLARFRRFWTQAWRDPASPPEGIDVAGSQAEGHAARCPQAMPLVILTAGLVPELREGSAAHAIAAMRQRNHAELLGISRHARQVAVPDSGHFIPKDRPDAVVAALQELYTRNGWLD